MSYSILISGLTNPISVAVDIQGNIYTNNNNSINKYDSNGNIISANFITNLNNPSYIILDSDSNIYIVNQGSGNIGKYNYSGTVINDNFISALDQPNAMAFDNQGNIYVVNILGNVNKYNSNGIELVNNLISGLANFYGISLDTAGNIYVSLVNGTNTVGKYDSSGNVIESNFIIGGNNSQPISLALDSQNNIYVSFHGINTIGKYNFSGTAIDSSLVSNLNNPWSISLDNSGNIYIANSGNGTIDKYTVPIPPPCFKEGSKILTDKGYIAIEYLRNGDLIKTLKNGYLPIVIIGKSEIYNSGNEDRIKNRLYTLSFKNYSELSEDLVLTGCHSILVDFITEYQLIEMGGKEKRLYITDDKVRLFSYLDPNAIPYEKEGFFTIYHIALENENYYGNYGIYANGLLVESCSIRYLKELSNMTFIE